MRTLRTWTAAAAAACVLGLTPAFSIAAAFGVEAATVDAIYFTNLRLDEDGTASWDVQGVPAGDAVEKFQLQLSRQKNGTTKDDFKTVTTDDVDSREYSFSYSSTGRYRFRIRARLYGGNYSGWSDYSDFVVVTRDDLNGYEWDDDWDGNTNVVGNGYGNYGPGYNANGHLLYGGTTTTGTTGYGPGYTYQVGQQPAVSPSAPGTTVNYGWVKDANGWWYRHQDGSYPRSSWQHINDKWYFFNAQGYMQTSWIFWNNSWYYCLPEGPMATDWQNINEIWYYFNEAGVMQTGYQNIGGKTYYLDATGARFTNGTTPDGHVFDANGVMIR